MTNQNIKTKGQEVNNQTSDQKQTKPLQQEVPTWIEEMVKRGIASYEPVKAFFA